MSGGPACSLISTWFQSMGCAPGPPYLGSLADVKITRFSGVPSIKRPPSTRRPKKPLNKRTVPALTVRVRPAGTVFWCYVLLYSVGRGVIEFWRGDAFRGLYFGGTISTSQIIAIGGVVLSVAMLLRGLLHHRQTASA